MKLVTFATKDGPRLGAVRGEDVIDLAEASGGKLPADMIAFLEAGAEAMDLARKLKKDAKASAALSDVTLLAPVPCPSKVIAIGQNYMDHCREQGVEPPTSPVIFTKFTTAIVGPGAEVRWDPALTSKVDYEVELAVVIGKEARRVSADDALDYVAGSTVCNDVSARNLQFSDGQWVRGKSLDTFCPLGPWLVTRDEIAEPQDLALRSIGLSMRQRWTGGQMRLGASAELDAQNKPLLGGIGQIELANMGQQSLQCAFNVATRDFSKIERFKLDLILHL